MHELTSPRPTQLYIAKVCHSAVKAYCDSLGDIKEHSWDDLPQSDKESLIAYIDLYTENPFIDPKYCHDAWVEFMLYEGWTYGLIENEVNKTHPFVVSYDKLPVKQHVINSIVEAIVKTMNKK